MPEWAGDGVVLDNWQKIKIEVIGTTELTSDFVHILAPTISSDSSDNDDELTISRN